MKVGLYLATQFTPEADMRQQLDNIIAQVRTARDSGFTSLWAAQHFVTAPVQMIQPMPLLARLLPEAEGMTIGPNILPLPLHNPLQVAEEAATMDLLSGGNYCLGIGLGYRDAEFDASGINKKTRVGRFEEAILVIRQLWREERVTHKGKHFHLDDVGTSLKPVQSGGCPILVAAVVEKAIQRAAVVGDGWLITFYPSVATLGDQLKLFRDARKAAGLPEAEEYPVLRECYVGADANSAVAECQDQLKYKYDSYHAWGQDKILPEADRFDQPFEQFRTDRFVIGDTAQVKDDLQRYKELLGVDHFMMRMQWPGLDQNLVLKSIERLGKAAAQV